MIADQYTASDPPVMRALSPGLPRATPAASRAEGLLAAYRIARSINDPRAARIAASLKSFARFQLRSSSTATTVIFLPDPERARGGFRESLTSMRIRIDFVQHNISSLLGIADSYID